VKRMKNFGPTATISVTDMPQVIAGMRCELSRLLREVASDEEPRVAERLMEIAAAFEAGISPGDL
jgi:hypothetical protein